MAAPPAAGLTLIAMAVAAAALGRERLGHLSRPIVAVAGRLGIPRPAPPKPRGRPIELIARDAYRLGRQFRHLPPGVSFARFEARRLAYDEVLAEACLALGVEHLLGVLPPGTDLDRERQRVEVLLDRAGLSLDDSL